MSLLLLQLLLSCAVLHDAASVQYVLIQLLLVVQDVKCLIMVLW